MNNLFEARIAAERVPARRRQFLQVSDSETQAEISQGFLSRSDKILGQKPQLYTKPYQPRLSALFFHDE